MKKYLCMILVMVLLLSACGTEPEETKPTEAIEPTEEMTIAFRDENDLRAFFSEYVEADWVVVDCALIDESAYGVVGVIQYTTDDYEGCMFDFVRTELPVVRIGVEAEPVSPNGQLRYDGNDRISCRMRDAGREYTCTIAWTVENGEIHFSVTGE